MGRIKWWRHWRLGLEFWLPLPLVGLAFWGIGTLVTNRSLNSNRAVEPFQVTPDTAQPSSQVVYIKVTVDRDRNISQVRLKQATQVYQRQEFELATADLQQIETAIIQRLDLSPQKVNQLLRYQFED